MAVTGPGSVHGSPSIRPVQPTTPDSVSKPGSQSESSDGSPLRSPTDEVDISSAGRMMNEAVGDVGQADSVSAEMRAERLARIKAAIDDGTYDDSDERLEAAFSRMIDRVVEDMD